MNKFFIVGILLAGLLNTFFTAGASATPPEPSVSICYGELPDATPAWMECDPQQDICSVPQSEINLDMGCAPAAEYAETATSQGTPTNIVPIGTGNRRMTYQHAAGRIYTGSLFGVAEVVVRERVVVVNTPDELTAGELEDIVNQLRLWDNTRTNSNYIGGSAERLTNALLGTSQYRVRLTYPVTDRTEMP